MVPEIKITRSPKSALHYNERKLKLGKAELIHAENFLRFPHQMNLEHKLNRFENLMMCNERAQTKAIHISLNFHPSEKEKLNKDLLRQITDEYMKRIGFEMQPYLVYQHHDTGHPHVHIVSTLIRNDGSRISTHNIGCNQSRKARKELEHIYELVSANKKKPQKKQAQELGRKPIHVQKLKYGKAETKQSISNVLDLVINQYKFTTLQEFNAALQQYNVFADRGREGGWIYKHHGLTYSILNEYGKKIGMPIKASSIENKPTLSNLEKKFLENEVKRATEIKRLRIAIEWILVKPQKSFSEFVQALEKEGVSIILSRDKEQRGNGFIYIDHQTKSVFSEMNMGKEYSAERILERLGIALSKEKTLAQENEISNSKTKQLENEDGHDLSKALELVMRPKESKKELTTESGEEHKQINEQEYSLDF